MWSCRSFPRYTPKTGIPVEEGDSILNLPQRVSHPDIQLGVGIHSELDNKPPLLLSTVREYTYQDRSKLLTFSLRKLSTSSFIINFLECILATVYATLTVNKRKSYLDIACWLAGPHDCRETLAKTQKSSTLRTHSNGYDNGCPSHEHYHMLVPGKRGTCLYPITLNWVSIEVKINIKSLKARWRIWWIGQEGRSYSQSCKRYRGCQTGNIRRGPGFTHYHG